MHIKHRDVRRVSNARQGAVKSCNRPRKSQPLHPRCVDLTQLPCIHGLPKEPSRACPQRY